MLRTLAVWCFSGGYSSRVAPLRCSLRLPPEEVNTKSFPISSAKVQQLSDICKFLGKKMHLYPHFRKSTNKFRKSTNSKRYKKRAPKGSLFDSAQLDYSAATEYVTSAEIWSVSLTGVPSRVTLLYDRLSPRRTLRVPP